MASTNQPTDANEELNSNKEIVNDTQRAIPDNEQLEQEQEYNELLSNGKDASDPSAQRNVGAGGYTQRADQKDQLENLHYPGRRGRAPGRQRPPDTAQPTTGPGFEYRRQLRDGQRHPQPGAAVWRRCAQRPRQARPGLTPPASCKKKTVSLSV